MLSTLMRYDFKRQFKKVLPVCAGMLICAALFVFIFWRMENLVGIERNFAFPYGLIMILSFFAVPAGFFAVFVMIFAHFYKSTMTDEGYLTFTLPVSHNQILASKVISGTVCAFVGILVAIVAFLILFLGMEAVSVDVVDVEQITEATGTVSGVGPLVLSALLAGILTVIRSVIQIIFVVILGGVAAKNHKIWGAIGFYLLTNFAINFLNGIVLLPYGIFTADSQANPLLPATVLLLIEAAVQAIVCVVLYLWTLRMLERKLNLQ